MPEGSYRITATIADGTSNTVATAPGTVTIDRTAPSVEASPRSGTFTTSLAVTLAANESATIYYTLDGSTPTVSSPQYSAPITISQTTTIRFMAVDRAGNASPVVSETYTQAAATQYWLFGYGKVSPPPTGYQGQFAFLATGPANPDGWLSYQCSKAKLQWVSTSITAVTVSGQSATISGTRQAERRLRLHLHRHGQRRQPRSLRHQHLQTRRQPLLPGRQQPPHHRRGDDRAAGIGGYG